MKFIGNTAAPRLISTKTCHLYTSQ